MKNNGRTVVGAGLKPARAGGRPMWAPLRRVVGINILVRRPVRDVMLVETGTHHAPRRAVRHGMWRAGLVVGALHVETLHATSLPPMGAHTQVRPYVTKQLNDETMKNNRRTGELAGLKPAPARPRSGHAVVVEALHVETLHATSLPPMGAHTQVRPYGVSWE
jgi:hypothetical protein